MRAVFGVLQTMAREEVAMTGKFAIAGLVTFKLKHKLTRKAGTSLLFWKEVKYAAKPPKKAVAAFPVRGIRREVAMQEARPVNFREFLEEYIAFEARRQAANQAAL